MAHARHRQAASGAAERQRAGRDALPVLLATLAALGISAIAGFPKLAFPGSDNDSLMRLVEVRDLLAGQGWFDLHQYRMGAEGGLAMHWSRLVDAPIAGLILVFKPLVGQPQAELAAKFIWPASTMAAALWFIVKAARRLGGDAARLPALALGATALHFLSIFVPGSLDHHNVQLALILAVAAGLAAGSFAAGLGAGAAAAASLAIGMETIPYVAAAAAAVVLLLAWRGAADVPVASGFGAGFAGAAALLLLITIRPSQWPAAACDAFSGAQAGQAMLGGLGLAAVAHLYGEAGRWRRLGALAGLAAASALYLAIVYPQCLAPPYPDLDARLRTLWLDRVSEAQPLWALVFDNPAAAALYYVTPLIALALTAARIAREGLDPARAIVGLMLLAAFAVSLWQLRGASFSVALATLPLAAWVGGLRSRHAARPSAAGSLRLAGAWLASFNVVWGLAAAQIAAITAAAPTGTIDAERCETALSYKALAELAPGTVAAVSNLGAPILAFTGHRTLAGPYHRNVAGNAAVLDLATAVPAAARDIAARHGIDYVAVCPGNPESLFLAGQAPDGLLARLAEGETPDWLEPAAGGTGTGLAVYRRVR